MLTFLISRLAKHYNVPFAINLLFCIFPTYPFFYGLLTLGTAAKVDGAFSTADLFLFRGYGANMSFVLLFILGQGLFLIFCIAGLEYYIAVQKRPKNQQIINDEEEEDQDVATERRRVEESNDDDIIQIVNVGKVYGKGKNAKTALQDVTLGIGVGTCFGLLGPNGAGKTTLLNILSGVIGATSGKVYINGREGITSMGVCPQSDRVWENLTVREHVKIYSLLRGKNAQYVASILNEFHMDEYADKPVKECSGGMKRKLSVAMAFIGDPHLILLDEPSSGMDPSTRRQLWNLILRLIPDRAVILTSHSMEEIDALCERIGIVVNGKLRAVGSSQQLKSRYGSGYRLSMTTNQETEEWILKAFPSATLMSHVNQTYHYEIATETSSLGDMFEMMEENKEKYQVTDYSISQTTLEQVFLNFARKQL
jgi:ATP-binding cassette subfamily A (ABC1) protein 2